MTSESLSLFECLTDVQRLHPKPPSSGGGRSRVLGINSRAANGTMSGEKATSPCSKFQANIFNKSKCQNCFKSRELHLLTDHGMEQAKALYGGWLCLAPEGTDFDNPMQKSRKWQRRFFILYEDGSLSFALDELPSTLPQGTLNLNLCTDITDAEPKTGQRNALCIATPEQEIFIRGDNKEIINGWTEQLAVSLRTNKQNQKKKRKVEPVATQEPSPAKMAATEPSCPSPGNAPEWQGDAQQTPMWTVPNSDPRGLEKTPAGNASSYLSPASLDLGTGGNTDHASRNQPDEDNNIQTNNNNIQTPANNNNQSYDNSHGGPTERLLGSEASGKEQEEGTAVSRTGRSEARTNKREKLQSCGDISQLAAPPPQRRAKSLDRRTSDTVMTPDLLNFKKGWMVKLDENDQWKKYWFVLSMDTLRCYKDSVAEEASDLDGEIDLTRCYSVSEYPVQRNYGFQIHTPKGVFTLSAMTSGIRKNWMQALMKNVRPATAPDVTSVPGLHVPCSPPEALPKPDVTRDSSSASAERDPRPKRRSVMERRREGRYKTFDWAEFRPQNKRPADPQRTTEAPGSLESGELERRTRREERRRRYEGMLGFPLGWDAIEDQTAGAGGRALSPRSRQKVEEEIEECWKQVERTAFRMERHVPTPIGKDSQEEEKLLDGYRKGVEDLQAQLAESERVRLDLQAQLVAAGLHGQQLDPPLPSPADPRPSNANDKPASEETRERLEERNRINAQEQLGPESPPSTLTPQAPPGIWLHDPEGNLQALPGTEDAPSLLLLPPASEKQLLCSQSDGQTDLNQNPLDRSDRERVPVSETQTGDGDFSPLILEDEDPLGGCVELHVPPAVGRLSREVQLLTGQNEALNQRNQEMLNQLTEADREIERLKAELGGGYAEVERLARARVEDLENELNARDRRLLEAQTAIASLQENVRQAEALRPQNAPREPEETGAENKGYLLRCFEATEAKLTELEGKLERSERDCGELRAQNEEMRAQNEEMRAQNEEMRAQDKEIRAAEELREKDNELRAQDEEERAQNKELRAKDEELRAQNKELRAQNEELRAKDEELRAAEERCRRLEEESEKATEKDGCVSGEERIRHVIDGMVVRLKALERLLEAMNKFDFGLRKEEEEEEEETSTVESQLRWEEEFWGFLLDKLEADPCELDEENPELLSEVTERMMVEKQVLLLGHRLLSETPTDAGGGVKEPDVIWSATETGKMDDGSRALDGDCRLLEMQRFRSAARAKVSLLKRLASSSVSELQPTADRLHQRQHHPWAGFIHSAATEALHCRRLSRLRHKYERRLEETRRNLRASSALDCGALMEENRELRARLSDLKARQQTTADGCSQTEEEEAHPQGAGRGEIRHEEVDSPETRHSRVEGQVGIQETANGDAEKSDASHEEAGPIEMEAEPLGVEAEQISVLRRRVEELEEQLAATAEEMKEEHDGKMSSLQAQHEAEMEKLKVACERGFACVEESHLKVVEELQRRHRQEVERLLVERDTLLEEESAATATALEAIRSAHRLQLQEEKEKQERCRAEGGSGDEAHLHREELAACLRELEVLSQQFSLKCLENVHLVQALDAERKALCQCQQENQDLSTRNQELSGHLAAEISSLCSLAQQGALPLRQGMHLYQMEISLRVKESELQRLQQENSSLRDDLQAAQRDKRDAAKKCKDTSTQLSLARAKAERDMGELRDNLRLARLALDTTPPEPVPLYP